VDRFGYADRHRQASLLPSAAWLIIFDLYPFFVDDTIEMATPLQVTFPHPALTSDHQALQQSGVIGGPSTDRSKAEKKDQHPQRVPKSQSQRALAHAGHVVAELIFGAFGVGADGFCQAFPDHGEGLGKRLGKWRLVTRDLGIGPAQLRGCVGVSDRLDRPGGLADELGGLLGSCLQQFRTGIHLNGDQQQVPQRHPAGQAPQQFRTVGEWLGLGIQDGSRCHQQNPREQGDASADKKSNHDVQPGRLEEGYGPGLKGQFDQEVGQDGDTYLMKNGCKFNLQLAG